MLGQCFLTRGNLPFLFKKRQFQNLSLILPTVVNSMLSKSNATATMTKMSFLDSLAEWK